MDILINIAGQLELGPLTEPPRRLTGGFLHEMYALTTAHGRWAVKLLNPHIMARPTAMENFRRAEALEARLEEAGIPILPALTFFGRRMQSFGGRFYYIYDYFDGRALSGDELTEVHCTRIGEILARIHSIERRSEPFIREPLAIDWEGLCASMHGVHPALHALLQRSLPMLKELQSCANAAFANLPPEAVICHNDMDVKNVLWNGSSCRVIDLECLGWSNPWLELYELALCWSGLADGRIDRMLLLSFVRAYAAAGGKLPESWECLHDANCGRLEWLEYNLRRALGQQCCEEERSVGISESMNALAQLELCHREKPRLLQSLSEIV